MKTRKQMSLRIEEVVRRVGPITCGDLKRRIGPDARGPLAMDVLGIFRTWTGLSQEFGDAVMFLILSDRIYVGADNRIRLVVPTRVRGIARVFGLEMASAIGNVEMRVDACS
jgi:hypothetical protein